MKPLPFSDAYAGSQARLAAVMSDQGPPFLRLQQMAGGGSGWVSGYRAVLEAVQELVRRRTGGATLSLIC